MRDIDLGRSETLIEVYFIEIERDIAHRLINIEKSCVLMMLSTIPDDRLLLKSDFSPPNLTIDPFSMITLSRIFGIDLDFFLLKGTV